jgi:hypothetical protein
MSERAVAVVIKTMQLGYAIATGPRRTPAVRRRPDRAERRPRRQPIYTIDLHRSTHGVGGRVRHAGRAADPAGG